MLRRCSEKTVSTASLVASTSYSTCPARVITTSTLQRPKIQNSSGRRDSGKGKRYLSTLDISEKQTIGEIRGLKAKLASLDRKKEAEAANERAGVLDEDTLDMIYQAINTPDPITPEEKRLETKRKQKILGSGREGRPFLETWYGRQTLQRLASLERRLGEIQPVAKLDANLSDVEVYAQVRALLKAKRVDLEEGDMAGKGPLGADYSRALQGKSVEIDKSGLAVFSEPSVREGLLNKLQQLSEVLKSDDSKVSEAHASLPLGIATRQEWEALVIAFAYAHDLENVKKTLDVVTSSGHHSLLGGLMNAAMDIYAEGGNVEMCQSILSWMTTSGIFPNDYTRHCLIKSHVLANQLDDALNLLSEMESSTAASMQTYTFVIEHILRSSSSGMMQSKVWTLFNRMRLVAHPIPDAPLYALMIKACALGVPQPNSQIWRPKDPILYHDGKRSNTPTLKTVPDTERALDLFRELTLRYNIRPTLEVYTYVIQACAKRKDTYEKAFSIFQSMVEMERRRVGSGSGQEDEAAAAAASSLSFAPARETYNALLQGCARNGDLLRARWILAEMLRSATLKWKELVRKGEEGVELEDWEYRQSEEMRPDDKTLSLVFFAYSSYKPRSLKKGKFALVEREEGDVQADEGVVAAAAEQTEELAHESDPIDDEDTLTYRLPTTSKAIHREASALMERIKEDYAQQGGLLSSVRPSPHLLHSYIAVISAHCIEAERVEKIQKVLFQGDEQEGDGSSKSLFELFNLTINGYTCEYILDACSKMPVQQDVMNLAEKMWGIWIELGGNGHLYQHDERKALELGVDSLAIHKCWSLMIRIYAKSNQLDKSMKLVRQFAQLYPPPGVLDSNVTTKPSSSLLAPLFRSSNSNKKNKSVASIDDSNNTNHNSKLLPQSPVLLFKPIEILHLRLVESENRKKDVDYLTFLIRSYTKSKYPKMPQSLRGNTTMISKQGAISKIVQERAWSQSSPSSSSSSSSYSSNRRSSYG